MSFFGGIDIEKGERAERDAMIHSRMVPSPTPGVRAALSSQGVKLYDDNGICCRVRLPPEWRADADPFNHRRWFLLDERGMRRASCFWRSSGYEPDRGSIAVLEPDFIARRWEGVGSVNHAMWGEARMTWDCLRCRARMHYMFSRHVIEMAMPGVVAREAEQQEERFKAHECKPEGVPR